jgi:hypothetical protein
MRGDIERPIRQRAPGMQLRSLRQIFSWIATALLLTSASACAGGAASVVDPAPSDYQVKLAEYEKVHGAYEQEAAAYWDAVAGKRRLRNAKRRQHRPIMLADYVLAQPPVYSGPPAPINPNAPRQPPGERPAVPVIADFLSAARTQWGFVPDQPTSEAEFMRAYARAAAAAGLTRAQVVGIYAFETGGNGAYDTQAGVTPTRPNAISPALGYNQLLSTNTLSLLAEHGGRVVAALRAKARTLTGAARVHMERKIAALSRMIAFARSIPPRWSEYDRVAKHTAQGLGIHAVLLDVDIGPLLQVQKLANSVKFARAKGYDATLSAAELELMNLTGDGNGIDMVMMPGTLREQVPTANFFQPKGYARNPVARRAKVVAGLIAEIQQQINRAAQAQGARQLAAAF